VDGCLDAVVRAAAAGTPKLVSLVVFGSAASGGYLDAVSDVDLIVARFLLGPGDGSSWWR
jgi:predicted nucleotidyltransferase